MKNLMKRKLAISLLPLVTFCSQSHSQKHLWHQEPTYWEAAKRTTVTLPISKTVTNSGGNVIWTPEEFKARHDKGFQMNNKQLKVALWGESDKQVLSL